MGSAEFMSGGLPVGSQVKGVGFEEFTAGRNGPAYVVMSGAGVAAVSYRENGTGRPCLAAIGLDAARPRFCLDGELSGTEIRSSKVLIPFDVGGDRLVLMFARSEVHDIELVAKTGETMSRESAVKTKTSNDLRFSAYWHQDERLVVDEIVGHRSAAEPNEGIAPPKNAGGYSSVVRVSGPGFEQFVPGRQGVGYNLGELALPSVAVTHQLNGTGKPCITIAGLPTQERVCFTEWKPGERIQPTIKRLEDGRVLVAGFAKLDVARVDVIGHTPAETAPRDTVATPTTQDLSFFACVFDKTEMEPVEVRVEK